MRIEEQSQLWLEKMETEMALIAFEELPPIDRLKRMVDVSDRYLMKLRAYVEEFRFHSVEEEIYFFKKVKPEFYSWRIYAFEKYGVESWMPAGDEEIQRKYLLDEVKSLDRFFRLHDFHYQYFRLGAHELDSMFFVRGVAVSDSLIQPNVADPDPGFATRGDYLFSKFMALEKLNQWLQHQIFGLDGLSPVNIGQIGGGKLKWTGESINLVELAYGMWLTGQINQGNASVSEIVKWMEESFGIQIGRAYRRWTEISRRDRANATKYLDRMRDAINLRLENEDDLIKQRKNNSK